MVVETKDAQGCDIEGQRGSRLDIQPHPRNGDGANEVAVREREDPAVDCAGKPDELLRPCIDLCRRFASGAPILVELPIGSRFADCLRGEALVFAVLDLPKKGSQLRIREACDLSGVRGSLQRARVDHVEFNFLEAASQALGLLLTVSCQR